jgi:DnaD/phage-associated family protein
MAWIESHQELARHPKTKKLSRLLGVSLPAAVGHLHFLWWWAMDYAQDGDISRFDEYDIADACGWDGEAKKIVTALIDSGFVDQESTGLVIHDWYEYAGRLIDKREQNRERKRRSRQKNEKSQECHAPVTRLSRGQIEDGDGGHMATKPNQTIPNHTTTTTDARETRETYFQAYERVNQRMMTPYQAQQLGKYIDEEGFDESVIVRAIERAGMVSPDVRLVLKILNDYAAAGAKTLDRAILFDQKFDQSKAARASPKGAPKNKLQRELEQLQRLREEELMHEQTAGH